MRPFLVTEPEAGRLPRLALIALILLYVLPGFVGRDPWRTGDAIGFGIAHAMVSGGARQWLLPEVAGSPVTDAAPLAYWFAAAIAACSAGLATSFSCHFAIRASDSIVCVLLKTPARA